MAEKSGDQTEKPTEKKVRDSREEGNVHRSEDLTKSVLILVWLALFFLLGHFLYTRVEAVMADSLQYISHPQDAPLFGLLYNGLAHFLVAVIPFILAAAFLSLLVDFLQVGPLLAVKKVQPKMSHLNPIEGTKKKFSGKNMVEVAKSIFKTATLLAILLIVLFTSLNMMLDLPHGSGPDVLEAYWHVVKWIGIWVVIIFFFVSVLDAVYQRHAFIKELMMSRRDIRQEQKDTQGDAQMKNQRQSLHKEWGEQNMLSSVRESNVVVTNPTHIAIALYYDAEETDLPVVSAKGEDYEARLIRDEAEAHGIPVMQDISLARGLYDDIPLDDYISSEFFDAVAQVLHWAETVREADQSEPNE